MIEPLEANRILRYLVEIEPWLKPKSKQDADSLTFVWSDQLPEWVTLELVREGLSIKTRRGDTAHVGSPVEVTRWARVAKERRDSERMRAFRNQVGPRHKEPMPDWVKERMRALGFLKK